MLNEKCAYQPFGRDGYAITLQALDGQPLAGRCRVSLVHERGSDLWRVGVLLKVGGELMLVDPIVGDGEGVQWSCERTLGERQAWDVAVEIARRGVVSWVARVPDRGSQLLLDFGHFPVDARTVRDIADGMARDITDACPPGTHVEVKLGSIVNRETGEFVCEGANA